MLPWETIPKKIAQNLVISSWKDSIASGQVQEDLEKYIQVPRYGVLKDVQKLSVPDHQRALENIWRIGGETGWYYGSWLWKIRGFLDKLNGGPGLRRGRTHPDKIFPGDALDFWRVLLADKKDWWKRAICVFRICVGSCRPEPNHYT